MRFVKFLENKHSWQMPVSKTGIWHTGNYNDALDYVVNIPILEGSLEFIGQYDLKLIECREVGTKNRYLTTPAFLIDMLPLLKDGICTSKFTFSKQGSQVSIKLYKEH